MNQSFRRARLLAFFLDLSVCAVLADLAALSASAAIWFWLPGWRERIPWVWGAAAAGGLAGFLLRDSSGGRARRWLALAVADGEGRPPGAWGSIRRNLPLIVPIWNVLEAWPVLRRGEAQRPSDRRRGFRVVEAA